MREWRFVVAAYVVTWIVLIGYSVRLYMVSRRAAALRDESVRGASGPAGTAL